DFTLRTSTGINLAAFSHRATWTQILFVSQARDLRTCESTRV
uniref:Uncharacterized protein n=1 Tax=Mesocestoides corti TaxID=53468 RepID=A0A5K3FYE4_MESCO